MSAGAVNLHVFVIFKQKPLCVAYGGSSLTYVLYPSSTDLKARNSYTLLCKTKFSLQGHISSPRFLDMHTWFGMVRSTKFNYPHSRFQFFFDTYKPSRKLIPLIVAPFSTEIQQNVLTPGYRAKKSSNFDPRYLEFPLTIHTLVASHEIIATSAKYYSHSWRVPRTKICRLLTEKHNLTFKKY